MDQDGATDAIWLWKVPTDKIGIIYKNIFYTAILDTSTASPVTARVTNGNIVRVSRAELMPSMTLKDWLNLDGCWTKDTLLQVSTLASRGIISKVERMHLSSENLVPDDIIAAASAISVVDVMILGGFHLNLSQWDKLEEYVKSLDCGEFVGGVTVDRDSGHTFARICSKARKVVFGNVAIEDISGFINNLVMCINRRGAECQQLQFGKEIMEKYKNEIFEMTDKLGWTQVESDDAGFKIEKDDKFEERQSEYAENQWHILNDSDRISCLKLQFNRIESKLDNLTQLFKQTQAQNQEEAEAEAASRQRQIWRMQDQMQKLELDRQRRQHERLMRGGRW